MRIAFDFGGRRVLVDDGKRDDITAEELAAVAAKRKVRHNTVQT